MRDCFTVYQTTDYSGFSDRINPDSFHDESYDSTLVDLIRLTLRLESPIDDDLLVQRIARAHDFKRAGSRIRERVLALVDYHFHVRQDPIDGSFVWLDEQGPETMMMFRVPGVGEIARKIEEIPSEEILLASLVAGVKCSAIEIARTLGNNRLTASGKERIERAIEMLKESRSADISAENKT